MRDVFGVNRRTALKTIGAGIVGGTVASGSAAGRRGRGRGPKQVVEIEAGHDHDDAEPEWWLDIDKQEVASGWITFEFDNQTNHLHFGYLVKVSEPALYDDKGDDEGAFGSPGLVHFDPNPGEPGQWGEKWRSAVNQPFQDAWDLYHDGEWPLGDAFDPEPGTFLGELVFGVPDWFLAPGFAEAVGGPGFTGGCETSTTTQYLDPGVYVLECYVLDDEGRFHSPFGMVEHIEVTDEDGKGVEPRPDIEVSIDSEDGITFEECTLRPGRYTVGITFEDNALYPNFLGHDVQLLRKDDVEDGDLAYWMDYLDAEDPLDPASHYMDRGALTSTHEDPGPETFLGGVQDIYAGEGPGFVADEYPVTAYIDVTLKPGEYAWVAEVADPEGKDMLEEFTVQPPRDRGRSSSSS